MEHRRVCFCMLSLLPLVQISKLSQANSLLFSKVCCRTPRGVRGLKSSCGAIHLVPPPSHPSRGAWIEIQLKTKAGMSYLRRTPRGVRGLKSPSPAAHPRPSRSHPSRGAWIEINIDGVCLLDGGSHPSRGAWIEITVPRSASSSTSRTPRGVRGLKSFTVGLIWPIAWSHPSRGAWIEIWSTTTSDPIEDVAPLAGCVD